MKKISVLTPTGGRGEAFSLCQKWYSQQTIHSNARYTLEWLIVDDCSNTRKTLCIYSHTPVKAPKQWTPEINTQRYNLDALIEKVTGDYIILFEDDDYYSPAYIEEMVKLLESYDIVGLSNSKYYHLKLPGFKYMANFEHASLCQTAFTKKVLPLFYRAVHSGEYYFDIKLWKLAHEEKLKSCLLSGTNLSIGIKGMVGRSGLGTGHERVGYHGDNQYKMLQEWLGKDWEHYKPYLK